MSEDTSEMIEVTADELLKFIHCDNKTRDSRYLLIQRTNKNQLITQPFFPAALGTHRARMVPSDEETGQVVAASAFPLNDLDMALGLMTNVSEEIYIGLAPDGHLLIQTDRSAFPGLDAIVERVPRSRLAIRIPPAVGLVFYQHGYRDFHRAN